MTQAFVTMELYQAALSRIAELEDAAKGQLAIVNHANGIIKERDARLERIEKAYKDFVEIPLHPAPFIEDDDKYKQAWRNLASAIRGE